MNWFLYNRDLRHERVNPLLEIFRSSNTSPLYSKNTNFNVLALTTKNDGIRLECCCNLKS